jgi:hypothetical protein
MMPFLVCYMHTELLDKLSVLSGVACRVLLRGPCPKSFSTLHPCVLAYNLIKLSYSPITLCQYFSFILLVHLHEQSLAEI